jgi:hypothetical protein
MPQPARGARGAAYWDRPIDVIATRPIIRDAAFEQLTDRATAGIARGMEIDAVRSI